MAIHGNVLTHLVDKMSWNVARSQRLNRNIANFDIPGYKRTDIQPYEKSVRYSAAPHQPTLYIKEVQEGVEMSREHEMLQLKENAANYQVNLNIYKNYLGMLKTIIGKVGG
jgi:flagellar basal-body rod protein FlgB